MKKSSVLSSFLVAAALLLPLSLFADHHEEEAKAPTLHDVWLVVPKNGMEEEFMAAIAADTALRIKGGDSRAWQIYTVAIGDHPNVVQFRYCCFDWADQDAYDEEEEGAGYNDHWNEKVAPLIEHYHRYFEISDLENSHWPDGEGDGPYYGVTSWDQKQGAGPAGAAAKEKMSQIAINDGWAEAGNNWMWLSRVGGSPKTAIVSSFESFADMAPPEQSFFEFLTETIGAEEAGKVFSDFGSGFTGSDYTVWVHQPELSIPYPED
jgi:hypothetical protein